MKGKSALRLIAAILIMVLIGSLPLSLSLQAAPSSTADVEENICVTATSITVSGDAERSAYEGKDDVYRIYGNADMHGEITVSEGGRYRLLVSYGLDDSNRRQVELTATVNGKPLDGVLTLPRVFRDEFRVDGEIRPSQLAVVGWFSEELRRDDYRRGEYLYIELTAGTNTVDLHFEDQILWVDSISLVKETARGLTVGGVGDGTLPSVTLEAEHTSLKSDSSIPPTYDIANAVVSPYQHDKTLLNTIGGASWSSPGQWLEWELPIEKAGYYCISLRVRQNTARGLNTYRRITVDGQLPCDAWEAYGFGYQRGWYVETLADAQGQPVYIWLDEGIHTLRMEAVMGNAQESYRVISQTIEQLNTIYRKIIMITGASPDANRSYQLYKRLPIREELCEIAAALRAEQKRVESDGVGTELSALEQTAVQLENYADDETRLVQNLAAFNSDVTALATKLSTLSAQPLEMDVIHLSHDTSDLPATKVSFFTALKNAVLRFFDSFVSDYGAMDTAEGAGETITVWVMTGRDQSQIIRDMVNDSFTPSTGVAVKLSLATAGFNEAVMSGRGPDVCIGTERTNAINLGVRNVLYDLKLNDGFENVAARFQETAFNGYTYEGKVYALPATQEFDMLFIRTDIYEELGLKIPTTWEQLQEQVAILGRYNMQAGIPSSLFTTLLLQNGMTYYTEDMRSTVFGTVEAYEAYIQFARYFTDYEVPISYNAQNRFRSGEMPILISPFSFYNTFALLAPELGGKWAMYEVPGTVREDGSVNRAVAASGLASVILKDTKAPDEAFAFLDWFSNTESQTRFCREIEDVLGASGRYATANVEAFDTTNWSSAQRTVIQKQRESVWEIPQTPFSYIIDRNLSNLFVNVVNNDAEIRESMLKYERIIQSEIDRKYEELALYKKGE